MIFNFFLLPKYVKKYQIVKVSKMMIHIYQIQNYIKVKYFGHPFVLKMRVSFYFRKSTHGL